MHAPWQWDVSYILQFVFSAVLQCFKHCTVQCTQKQVPRVLSMLNKEGWLSFAENALSLTSRWGLAREGRWHAKLFLDGFPKLSPVSENAPTWSQVPQPTFGSQISQGTGIGYPWSDSPANYSKWVGEPDYWLGYPQSKAPAGSSPPLLTILSPLAHSLTPG